MPKTIRPTAYDEDSDAQLKLLATTSHRSQKAQIAQMIGKPAPPLVIERWFQPDFWHLNVKNRVVVVDFWGVWCAPCIAQLPKLAAISDKYSSDDLLVIGVHSSLQREQLPAFLDRRPIPYPVGIDHHDRTAERFNLYGYPSIYVIDQKGVLRAVDPPDLDKFIETLLKE